MKTPPPTPEKAPAAERSALRGRALDAPPGETLNRILEAPRPAALVRSLPEEEVYLLVQEIGPEDALPILSLVSPEQRDFILDMEIWERDRIDNAAADRWIALFYLADPDGLTRWFMEQPEAIAEYFLYRNIEVVVREHDQDPSDFGDDGFTVDNTFYLQPRHTLPEKELPREEWTALLTDLLRRMAEHDHVRYQKILLEAAGAVIPSEFEEEAYRLRNNRLAEKGFLPFEEAVGIYQPLKPADLERLAGRYVRLRPAADPPPPAPRYLSGAAADDSLFVRALGRIADPDQLETLEREFASLCNRIAVADRGRIGDRRALEAVVHKALGYIDTGLERLSGDDGRAADRDAPSIVARHPLFQIFRVGYGQAAALKQRAHTFRRRSWAQGSGLPLTFWGEAWLGVLGGLLLKRPLYFDNYESGVLYREFASLADARRTERTLDRLVAFDALLSDMAIRLGRARAGVPLSHRNLLLTQWARSWLDMPGPFEPVGLAAFRTFYRALWVPAARPARVRGAMKQAFLEWLSERSGWRRDDISSRLGETLEALFEEIETEYGNVAPEDLDPRFTPHFWIADDGEAPPGIRD